MTKTIYINLSSNVFYSNIDTRRHSQLWSPGLGLQCLAVDGEGKGVWTRPETIFSRTELSKKKKKIWQMLSISRDEKSSKPHQKIEKARSNVG